jgi:transposase
MGYYLSKKKVRGRTYYYAQRNIWTSKGSRVAEQIYLGSADMILKAIKGEKDGISLKTYRFGRTAAILSAAEDISLKEIVERVINKNKGYSFEELMLLVPTGKFEHRTSKLDIVEWYSRSYIAHYFNLPRKISTESIYRMMDRLDDQTQEKIGERLAKKLMELGISPSIMIFDTTNFATNIEHGEKLPQKGHSKEGKDEQNLIGLALAITPQNIPFLWNTYEGCKNDAKVFPDMVNTIVERLKQLTIKTDDIILVFDRGNNSKKNMDIALIKMHVIGGVRRNQAKKLYDVPLTEMEFLYETSKENKVFGYKTKHVFFDRGFTCVVTYNEASMLRQLNGFEEQKRKILEKLTQIDNSLGRKGKGRKLSVTGAVRKANDFIHKNFRSLIKIWISDGKFCWKWNDEKEKFLRKTFGKQVLFTDLHDWSAKEIAMAYNKKSLIESDFKMMRNSLVFPIPPVGHRKDKRIKSHVFLCLLGIVLYRYALWKTRNLGITEDKFLDALDEIQVSLVSGRKAHRAHWVVNQMDTTQASIFTALNMERFLPKDR